MDGKAVNNSSEVCQRLSALVLTGLVVLSAALPASAQERPAEGLVPVAPPPRVSPRGAFVRAALLPGWGHVSIGSYGRAGFYFAAETGTLYALIQTRMRLSEARKREAFRERVLREQLAGEGLTDPAEIQQRLDGDGDLAGVRGLVTAREGQQEDWVALGIFLLLLSSADAFVSAHLADFPEPLSLAVTPSPMGRTDVGLRVAVPY